MSFVEKADPDNGLGLHRFVDHDAARMVGVCLVVAGALLTTGAWAYGHFFDKGDEGSGL